MSRRRSPSRGLTRWSAFVLSVGVASGLSTACSDSPTVPPQAAARLHHLSLASRAAPPDQDQYLAQIADRIPGFAGFYVRDGTLVLRLKGDVSDSAAERVRESMRSDPGVARFKNMSRLLLNASVRVEASRYDARELWVFKSQARKGLFAAGAHLLDLDESEGVIRVGAAEPEDAAAVTALAASLGIPGEAIVVEVMARARPSASLSDRFRPVPGGVAIDAFEEEGGQCTLTLNAFMPEEEEWGFFTASHCTETFGANDGAMHQNTYGYGNVIGWEIEDPALLSPGSGGCPSQPGGCRYSDASFFVYESDTLPEGFTIARTTNSSGSTTVSSEHPRFLVSGTNVDFPYEGLEVHKIGWRTGWTVGEVTNTCVDAQATDGIVRLCSMQADYSSDFGDSGSPVFTWDGDSNYIEVVGIHWGAYPNGGDALYCSWLYVQLEVEGELYEGLQYSD